MSCFYLWKMLLMKTYEINTVVKKCNYFTSEMTICSLFSIQSNMTHYESKLFFRCSFMLAWCNVCLYMIVFRSVGSDGEGWVWLWRASVSAQHWGTHADDSTPSLSTGGPRALQHARHAPDSRGQQLGLHLCILQHRSGIHKYDTSQSLAHILKRIGHAEKLSRLWRDHILHCVE